MLELQSARQPFVICYICFFFSSWSMSRIVSDVNLYVFCFFFYRPVHQELLLNPCKAEFEDAVHLKNKFKSLHKTLNVFSLFFTNHVLGGFWKDRPARYFIWNRLSYNRLSYSTKLTVVEDQITQMHNYI